MSENAYKRYLLGVLLALLAFSYVDRFALGLLLQDIKADLQLSDTQLGLLTGLAFALFYSIMGIPIARWADRGNRITILSATVALGSAAVALCGMAGNFLQLVLARIAVAVGEAGCTPPSHSLIADYFSRAERPRAVAVYMLGAPASMVIGYFGAGWLNELYGWRMTFIILAIPGPVLAALTWLTLREPRRAQGTHDLAVRSAAIVSTQAGLREVYSTLYRNATFRHLLLCFSVASLFGNGMGQWMPTFFLRSFGLTTGELGTWFAVIYGAGGLLGTYLGGALASRHAANDERLQLSSMAVAYGVCAVASALMYLTSNLYLALTMMAVVAVIGGAALAPLFAAIQTLVPPPMRAMSIALVYLFANLIGMGFGPLAAGALSDLFRPWAGEESLRYALLALCPGYLWVGWHSWRASKTVARDVEVTLADQKVESVTC